MNKQRAAQGVLFGLGAYLVWGFFPIYFKLLATVPALEVLCHRIVWSLLFLVPLCAATGKVADLRAICADRKALLLLGCTTLLIATNWLVFIMAVSAGKILESSLGYFINPLVNALLGGLFLGERLHRLQQVAIGCAACGVFIRTLQVGSIPWIALILALSFGFYGLLRKRAGTIDAIAGLTIETALLALPAFSYLLYRSATGAAAFPGPIASINLLLPLSGVITAIPLLWFAAAARRLRLTTIGFLQYMTPTLHLIIAVALYGEAFSAREFTAFALIWCGIALYTFATLRSLRQTGSAPAQ